MLARLSLVWFLLLVTFAAATPPPFCITVTSSARPTDVVTQTVTKTITGSPQTTSKTIGIVTQTVTITGSPQTSKTTGGAQTVTTTITGNPQPTAPVHPSQCSNENKLCCDHVDSSGSLTIVEKILIGLLGIVFSGSPVDIGFQCGLLGGSNSCSQKAVCCNNNNFNGVIAIGCIPINLSL